MQNTNDQFEPEDIDDSEEDDGETNSDEQQMSYLKGLKSQYDNVTNYTREK